jgi:hypothetical protein
MKRVLTSILTCGAILLMISSCATVPEGPLDPGEMRLLSLDVPENGNLKISISYPVTIRFKADGRPEVRRVCFMWSGEGPRCIRVKGGVQYGSEASLDVMFNAPEGRHLLECYVEYVRDGKVRRTNTVSSYVTGLF